MMCNGNRLRLASPTAQPRARSLLGEPSTPTTMAPRGTGLLLMVFSLEVGASLTNTGQVRDGRTRHLVPRS